MSCAGFLQDPAPADCRTLPVSRVKLHDLEYERLILLRNLSFGIALKGFHFLSWHAVHGVLQNR